MAGCGGGGGSSSAYSGPTAAVAVTTTAEADTVAGYAASAALSSTLSSLTGNYTPLAASGTADTSPSPATLGNLTKRFADLALKAGTSAASTLPGVTQSQSQPCPGGGTITITVSVSNPNVYPQPGDSVTFRFNNCTVSNYVSTGSIRFVINSYTAYNDFSASYTYSRFKETNTTTGDYLKITGGYTAGLSSNGTDLTLSLTGSSIVFEASLNGTVNQLRYSDFSFVDIIYGTGDVSFDHDFTIASTEIGGSITVNTVTPFVIPAGNPYPTSGRLVVTGANNAKVRLTAQPDGANVFVEYDIAPADGVYESSATVPWSSL